MSAQLAAHIASDDDDDTSKDFMTFCLKLVHHSQWKSKITFLSGSFIDIPDCLALGRKQEVSDDQLDIDIMYYTSFHYVFDRSVILPETYTGSVLGIYTDNVHTGYVRLIKEKDNKELLMSDLRTLTEVVEIHGPALKLNYNVEVLKLKYSLSKLASSTPRYKLPPFITHSDMVHAVHSPYWPLEATEWITRRRSYGIPLKSVVKRVVRYGCDFVQVSHNRHSNDNEWRYSFSKAELILVKNWSTSQRIIYATLWVFNKKKIASKNLCTYFFKTLMFWACEEKPPQFWSKNVLVQSVCELLIEMANWVKSKFCVNYFIPGNNMMDHLIDTDLSHEIDSMWRTSESFELVREAVDICARYGKKSADMRRDIESLSWVKRVFIIYWRVSNLHDNYTDLLNTNLSKDLQKALYEEFSNIFRGLSFQQKSVSCDSTLNKDIYFLKSKSHLLLAINLCESLERNMIENCSEEFVRSVVNEFMPVETDKLFGPTMYMIKMCTTRRSTVDEHNSLNSHNEQKCELYSRSVKKCENKLNNDFFSERTGVGRSVNIAFYRTTLLNPCTTTTLKYQENGRVVVQQ